MNKAHERYLNCVSEKLASVRANIDPIEQTAQTIYKSFCDGGFLYAFGTGHSHMFAEEIFYRAGGLVRVKPIFDDRLMLHIGASQSTVYERQSGLSQKLLPAGSITEKDVIIIASNSGRNAVAIEIAENAKQAGAKVVALTSLRHSMAQKSRHPSGKRLFEIADLVLDNFGEVGDACIALTETTVAATSTVIGSAILEAIVARVAELGEEHGAPVETFKSSNVDGGDAINKKLIEKYKAAISIL